TTNLSAASHLQNSTGLESLSRKAFPASYFQWLRTERQVSIDLTDSLHREPILLENFQSGENHGGESSFRPITPRLLAMRFISRLKANLFPSLATPVTLIALWPCQLSPTSSWLTQTITVTGMPTARRCAEMSGIFCWSSL